MTSKQPPELLRLVSAGDPASRDQAWDAFVEVHSRLLLSVSRRFGGGDDDDAMDRYAYVLEQLRCDDFRRLRVYTIDGPGKFTTWLVAVARRLCLDHHRRRYGRPRGEPDGHAVLERIARRHLVDFVTEELDPFDSDGSDGSNPETELRAKQLREALSEALGGLPSRDRLMLGFRYEAGLTAREIARLMDFPSVFHVYRRLNRVQGSLRTLLEERGVDGAKP